MTGEREAKGGRAALIDDVDRAHMALSPLKRRLLAELREPGSAASLASGSACRASNWATTCVPSRRRGSWSSSKR